MVATLRKRIVGAASVAAPAAVEVTSEDPAHPIEAALTGEAGWRAGAPGRQTIRIVFDTPQRIERVALRIDDARAERTQEIALAWISAAGERASIVRQRWNFSPGGSTSEQEDYRFAPAEAASLELVIDPNVADATAMACLTWLRVG